MDTYREQNNLIENKRTIIRGADVLVQALEKQGIRRAFGIPGGAIGSIFNALSHARHITTTLCQHEGAAAYMALGRSLCVSGNRELGLCFSTSGPGITNLITGVAAAYEERVPIFALTGNVSTKLIGKGAAQDAFSSGIDAVRMLDPITWKSMTVSHASQIAPAVEELCEGARSSRLPVHLNVPLDIASELISDPPEIQSPTQNGKGHRKFETFDREYAMRSIQRFLNSPRPLVFAGNGIKTSGLEQLLRCVAETASLPVISTSHAKGIFPEDHRLFFGNFGFAANERSRRFLEEYRPTAILFLGTRLGETATLGWSPLLTAPELKIHVDADSRQLNKVFQVDFPIHADVEDYLDIILEHWAKEGPSPSPRLQIMEAHGRVFAKTDHAVDMHGLIHPKALVTLLDFWLPDDAILFSDIGSSMAWTINNLSIRDGQEFYVLVGLGAMGSGLCGAIGAKSAVPNRPVFCITGDGSALMHGTELFTALNAGLGVKILVLNDQGFGIVEHGQKLVGFTGDLSVRYKQPVDFKKFSESLGVQAFTVRTLSEFVRLPLDQLFSSEDPVLFDIHVDPRPVPPISSRTRVLGMTEKEQK